ncbi:MULTISPECIES: exodeoxyribonuclease V subunit alpha [unclassified Psychrobacter]|uniref:exodeoxyribonuclease V subunit alpha n=1 Tax=unclassified Psychrobacter TaxID=196806 RepID=UPI000EC9E99D|nr:MULTISPECIES: exodeoxyribonuclease V subunit alpha [unclassified Psychrobacter]MBE8610103.1 exodeoxyribonuclease V subunit alpha [Pseudomonas lundensis]HCI76611.1 exodeoxyribonuclease V subunit alpha [Psychrobacter sp.]
MSNNKKESKAVIGLQQSWASNISDYILLRREQTYLAYKATDAKANTDSKQVDKTEESNLFTALFVMLATHLEEGHTVLTIESSEHEEALQGQINNEVVTLYAWQQQLLEMLAMPIFALIDSKLNTQSEDDSITERSLFVLLDTLFDKKEQLWMQLALSNHEKEVLTKRFDMIATLYQLLKNTDLSFFIRLVNEHDLFAEVNSSINNNDKVNSLSKKNQPIIYKQVNSQNTEGSVVSLTFWLHRAWQAEFNLAQHINTILNQQITPLNISIPKNLNDQQIAAINVANNNAFSIITGGPGTGKTYTVAQLVIALQQATESEGYGAENIRFSTDSASLALAAPTGKAAQRMQESLQAALDAANIDLQLQEAKTIHRLLGIGRTGRPRYDTNNPLGEDIIIVDEASMLGVELANYLVSAVKPGARLILLGDANQLAAVDAGAVLADLCRIPLLQPIHAELTESRRFSAESGIGKLAYQINQAKLDTQAIWQLLRQDEALSFQYVNTLQTNELKDNKTRNSLSNKKIIPKMSLKYIKYINKVKEILKDPIEKSMPESVKNTITSLMETFNEFRILSAGHNGEWGDHYINNYLTQWHLTELKLPLGQNTWFHGRPVMVLQNNYELGLFNGDIGFCLQTSDERSRLEVFFENKTQGIPVNLLNEEVVATAYAMTIHKSQGSEFKHVAITFDNSHARLLSKELIYTAVTRAKKQVTIYSTESAFEKAVQTPTERHTGLALQFSKH